MKRLVSLLAVVLLTISPALAAYNVNAVLFGGHGQDGDLTKSGTESTAVMLNAKKFTVATSTTWNVKSGSVINSSSDINITGTVNVGTVLSTPHFLHNYSYGNYAAQGIGGGVHGQNYCSGGGGGGFGGNGGNGGRTITQQLEVPGGRSYTPDLQPSGSAGGAGGYWNGYDYASEGGDGGPGGGGIKFCSAGSINISGAGVVHIDGGNGTVGVSTASGGGGGSGGFGLFAALKSINVTATNGVTCVGGNGGNGIGGGCGGGGGAGGFLIFISPSISLSGGTLRTGGSIGTGTHLTAPQAGQTGSVLSIQAYPSLPLMAFLNVPGNVQTLMADVGESNFVEMNEAAIFQYIDNKKSKLIQKPLSFEKDKIRTLGEYSEAA